MLSCLKFSQNLALNKQKLLLRNVISNMSILNGLYIEHLWFTEHKQNILYHGHIISVKSTGKVPKATICYWTQEDIEEEGEDEKICILQLPGLLTILLEI